MDKQRQHVKKKSNPKESANLLSLLSFFYTVDLFKKGYKKSLEEDDLYDVIKSCRSQELGDQLAEQWNDEEATQKKPSISRVLWICFGKKYLLLGLVQFVMRAVLTLWSPYAQSKLVAYFEPNQTDLSKQDAIYYACVVIGLYVVGVFVRNNYMFAVIEMAVRVRTSVCSLLYRKCLKLHCQSSSDITVGNITTLITRDIDVIEVVVEAGNTTWIAIAQTGLVCYLVYNKIGITSLTGIFFFLLVLPIQIIIGLMTYNLRLKNSTNSDARTELIREVIAAIKIIKMYTWEKFFERKIGVARKQELKNLYKLFYTKVWIGMIGILCTKLAFFAFITTQMWLEENITAEVVFYVLGCFGTLEGCLSSQIPFGISYCAEAYAVAKRIEKVLLAKDSSANLKTKSPSIHPAISFNNVTAKIGENEVLHSISVAIKKGLNVIVGCVGSGKTTFLKTILDECQYTGEIKISGSISYASQDPWLFPSTIKNNILFGEDFHEERYKDVLKICNLEYDLHLLLERDETVVGDRGINLSKGQQARISLARAIYRDSDIYLLDDCLASLDGHVSDSIFRECLLNFLREKICLFVTNNVAYIEQADEVLMIEKKGMWFREKGLGRRLDFNIGKATDQNNVNSIKLDQIASKPKVYYEMTQNNKVSWKNYYRYIKYGGGLLAFGILLVSFITCQAMQNYSEKLMSQWVSLEQNVSNYKQLNFTNSTEYEKTYHKSVNTLYLYVAVFVTSIVLILLRAFMFFRVMRTASINMHQTMAHSVINATMNFHNTNFIGLILNRFSKDCFMVDEWLPFSVATCLDMVFAATGAMLLLTSINLVYLLESLSLLLLAYLLQIFYQPIGRNLQRLNITTRNPMIGYLNSTLEGLTTIRACKAQEIIQMEFDNHQNVYTSANYILNMCTFAFSMALELLCAIFATLVITQFLITDFHMEVGDVGLAITQAFVIMDIISSGITNLIRLENLMTSVERIVEYTKLEQEDKRGTMLHDWPKEGSINFNHVSLRYNNKNKKILDDVTFEIKSREKIGIVGRTGAGKSSVISSLFRLYPIDGIITIDGINIKDIPLTQLRNNISVIPQDPILFSETIRDNIDPLKQFRDEEIWKVLTDLKLTRLINDLHTKISKSENFSSGQKQLLCMARAILQKNKIVVLDEATANVDKETDTLICNAVQTAFLHCTVVVVSHKLSSILNCNKVIVLNNGKISELDEPIKLMQNEDSFLHYIVK